MIQTKLLPQQLTDVITLVFKGAIFKILRIIKEAGRSRVVWVYLVDRYGNRRATFISVREMNIAFLNYLNQCDYATRIGKSKQNRLNSQLPSGEGRRQKAEGVYVWLSVSAINSGFCPAVSLTLESESPLPVRWL
jgi:hypothetical protein